MSAGAVEFTDSISAECPRYDTKQSDGEATVMLGRLRMRSTSFDDIATGSTLAGSGCKFDPIDRFLFRGKIELLDF